MAIQIAAGDRTDKMKKQLLKFISNGKVGDCHQIGGTFANKYTHWMFVKCGPDLAKGYSTDRWGTNIKEPSMMLTSDGAKYVENTSKRYGGTDRWHGDLRLFLSIGLIPNIKVEYLREHTMITCRNQDTRIPSHRNIALSWDGDLISNIPSKVKELRKKVLDNDRNIRNRDSRARYHNKRVMTLMDKHRHVDEYDDNGGFLKKGSLKDGNVPGVVPMDVFSLINVAYRTELIESFTMEKVLEGIDHEVIDEQVIDKRPYELLRFQMPFKHADQGAITATYLKMINPSTGEYCVEGVPNNASGQWRREITMNTVEQALAWRDGDGGAYNVPQALA